MRNRKQTTGNDKPADTRCRIGRLRVAGFLFALVLILFVSGAAAAAEAPGSPQTTFFHANALYKDGQYEAAVKDYEDVLRAGLESGNLYFNLGNAYFKAGQRGRAILNYERARRVIPGDPDLEANLRYAQSLTGAEACVAPLWHRLAFPLAQRTATARLVALSSIGYTLLLLALAVYRIWPQRPRWLVYVATALGVALFVATTSLAAQIVGDDATERAVIVAAGDTPARFEPADNGTVHYVLKEGSLVRISDTRDGWLQVTRCDGRRGWVPKTAAAHL